ncbi:hypothetical protein SLE2022_131990 [Rubroshorea leprosula]
MDVQPQDQNFHLLPRPSDWFLKLLSFQSDVFHNCIVSVFSFVFSLFSVASESYHRAEEAKASAKAAVQNVPSNIGHGTIVLLKKIFWGFLGAMHVYMVLVAVMVLAALVGIGLVQLCLEEPVHVRETLYFDYTLVNPTAEFCFGPGSRGQGKAQMGVPVGHTFHVSLVLLMPESDFNRRIGVFQLNAELVSSNGKVIVRSSHPCMLQFRSLPIRLGRTFLLGAPLLLGLTSETQKISVDMLNIKEGNRRTKAVRVSLVPRAGTSSLPQLYEAEILIKSELPWTKRLVHNWRWTLYVWTSLYVYIIFLVILMSCFRSVLFPMTGTNFDDEVRDAVVVDESRGPQIGAREERNEGVSELIRKWQQSRIKRKAIVLQKAVPETVGSSASTMSVTREETSAVIEEDIGDSESVCSGN